MRESQRNSYLDSLNIDAPDLEALVAGDFKGKQWFGKPGNLHLLTCALLEAGRPLSFEEAAARLLRAGLEASSGDLVASLRRSWSGRRPIVKGPKGTVDLDLHAVELEGIVAGLGLRPETVPLSAGPAEAEEDMAEPLLDDDQPLSKDDLRCAFTDADLSELNGARQAAAVVDAHGGVPMPQVEVETLLAKLTVERPTLEDALLKDWGASPASLDGKGHVILEPSHRRMAALRRVVRKRARQARELAREEAEAEAAEIEWFRQEDLKRQRDHVVYRGLQRSVLHVVSDAGEPVAGTLLEFPKRGGPERVRIFLPGDLAALRLAIGEQDVIAGEDPRTALLALGCDTHGSRLIDLKPESWTALAPGGRRSTKLTRRSLLRLATGHVLLHPAAMRRLLAGGDREKLARQLRLDAWAITTLYRHGVIHRGVPLSSGGHGVFAPCAWSLPGEPDLFDLLGEVGYSGREMEFRFQPTATAGSPWQGSLKAALLFLDPDLLVVQGPEGELEVPTDSVRDLRVVALQ